MLHAIIWGQYRLYLIWLNRYLTSKAHLGGTLEENENAEYVKATWDSQGLDSTRIVKYNILLSYPRKEQPNHVSID